MARLFLPANAVLVFAILYHFLGLAAPSSAWPHMGEGLIRSRLIKQGGGASFQCPQSDRTKIC